MEKRQPLSVMIALQSKKLRGGDKPSGDDGAEPDGDEGSDDTNPKYDDEAMVSAAEDMIDAFKNRDAKALNMALCHWMEAHGPVDDSSASDKT